MCNIQACCFTPKQQGTKELAVVSGQANDKEEEVHQSQHRLLVGHTLCLEGDILLSVSSDSTSLGKSNSDWKIKSLWLLSGGLMVSSEVACNLFDEGHRE